MLRACAVAVPAASIGVPFLFPTPDTLPGVALGSLGFLHVEETFGVFLALSSLIVFAVRVWGGDLPIKTNHSGAEYQELAREAADQLDLQTDALQVQVDGLRSQVERAELAQKELLQLSAQLEALRDEIKAVADEVEAIADFVTR